MNKCRNSGDWYYTESHPNLPKSTTHEALEEGQTKLPKSKVVAKKQITFQSYAINDSHLHKEIPDLRSPICLSTSYTRDYAPPYDAVVCQPKDKIDNEPDFLFNRIPPSEFAIDQTSQFKFMDEQFIKLSEPRMKINFMRQLRNVHHPLV
ncbi:uncharacterized protein LOC142224230 [Haematobia irritans]|uniref:uncharacterized protein LOC142224230 n=1 Tax=Haematobia irritans TaxID=7368 RepID=UPI003F4FE5A3